MAVDEEVFQNFSMYHLAGLKDFSFMKKCQNVGDLRERLLVTGSGAGAGQVRKTRKNFGQGAMNRAALELS